MNEAATLIQEEADEDANIIFGAVIDESMGDEVRITVIATGFGESASRPAPIRAARARIEPSEELRGNEVAPDGRPIRRLGLREVDEYELEVPTWQRRQQHAGAQAARR